jgi:DNA-binding CsgD family transcriptional regulator
MRGRLPELVGREAELALLEPRLRAAFDGDGQVLLLSGEPGIGKTRLAQEVTARAEAMGMGAFWGRADGQEGVPPYWPFRQIIRAVASPELMEALGEAAADIAVVAPEVLPPATDALAAPGERFRIFESVTRLFVEAAAPSGVLLVVDDLQWADAASLHLIGHLARSIDQARIAVIATYRDTESTGRPDLRAALAGLAREDAVTRVRLTGLSAADVGAQLSTVIGHPVPANLVAVVSRRSQGNPFFVAELGRLLARSPQAVSGLPDGVRDAVRGRLGSLSENGRRAVSMLAALGGCVDVTALAAVTGDPLGDVLSALDEVTRAGIVDEAGGITHDLVAEVARLELPTVQRVTAHLRMARHLQGRADADSRVAEIAHHWLESLPAADVTVAVAWAERAARRATEQAAWEQAAGLYDRAVKAAGGELFTSAERARLLLARATAQLRAYDIAAAHESVLAAADIARAAGDADALARAALTLEGFSDLGWSQLTRGLCEQALAVVPAIDSAQRARLLAQLAVNWQVSDTAGAAGAVSEQALAMAERVGDPHALAEALRARQMARSGPDGVHERLDLGNRLVDLGIRAASPIDVLWGRLWRFDALLQLGRINAAEAELGPLSAVAEQLRLPLARWHVLRNRAAIAFARGRFDEALELAQQVRTLAERARHDGGLFSAELLVLMVSVQSGADPAAEHTARARSAEVILGSTAVLAAWYLAAGHDAQAHRIYQRWPAADEVQPFILLPYLTCTADLADAFGDLPRAEEVYRRLLPFADFFSCGGAGAITVLGSVRTALGVAAATLGRLDDAVRQLRSAVAANDAAGTPPFAAHARFELARVLGRRLRPGDRDEAAALAASSGAEADRLGMAPLLRRCRELSAALAETPPAPLTRREREIAAFVAQGLTNRQIGATAHISERTAEVHVQHCLTKLGFNTRAQLASWVTATAYRDQVAAGTYPK